MAEKVVSIGGQDFDFDVSNEDFNRYLNEQMPNDKVNPAYNFLIRTVKEDQKEELKKSVTADGTVKGMVVMQVAGVLAGDMGEEVSLSIKKPSESQKK